MIRDERRQEFRLRTDLPPATADAVVQLALQVLLPVADVVVVRHDPEAPWPPEAAAAHAELGRRLAERERASRVPALLRRADAAVMGGRDVHLDPARPADRALVAASLLPAPAVSVVVTPDVEPVLHRETGERTVLRLTRDELVRLRDMLVSRDLPTTALVELREAKALETTTWRGLLLATVLTSMAVSSALRARDDLFDGYGGPALALWDAAQLIAAAGFAVITAGLVLRGLRLRWRHRRRGTGRDVSAPGR